MNVWTPAFVGLGSNLGDPARQVEKALGELARLPGCRMVRHSGLYVSAPMGPAGQPDYVNAVAGLLTRLEPDRLLDALQAVEAAHGRTRGQERWGPRTLDLDIIAMGQIELETPRLTLPHPGAHRRNFVLVPLADIAPDYWLPGHGRVGMLAAAAGERGLGRLAKRAT